MVPRRCELWNWPSEAERARGGGQGTALASPYALEIMAQENPPRETGEMAHELEGNPGPSLSLELREEQESRWQDQPPESGSPMDQGRGGEKRPNSIWQTGGWTVEGSLVSSMAAAGGHRGDSQA